MGRHAYVVAIAALVSVALAESGFGQQPNGGRRGRMNRPMRMGSGAERWQAMRPDERQRFRSNAERWMQMPPQQQRMLREQEAMRRQHVQREADAALRQSGLQLEAEKREQYEKRYLQERRRIEQALRQELEEKRQRELAPVVEQLKKEFTDQKKSPSSPAASSSPSK